jgi:preprotein translocase SecF subunit
MSHAQLLKESTSTSWASAASPPSPPAVVLLICLLLDASFAASTSGSTSPAVPSSSSATRAGGGRRGQRHLAEAAIPRPWCSTSARNRDILIRLAPQEEGEASARSSATRLCAELRARDGGVELRRVEFVGPQVGEELREQGGLAVLFALIGILIYVALRFEWRFAVGAVAALMHDVLFTVGMFSLFYIPFDLTVLAAVLAVIGYSLNDTIVIFDRIRENFRKMRKGTVMEITNRSINQTLSRTIITSGTTLLVLLALYFLGGEAIAGFSLALIIGVSSVPTRPSTSPPPSPSGSASARPT